MALTSMTSNHNRPDSGSAKLGGLHWLKERILAVFMVPLTGWFICFILRSLPEHPEQTLTTFKNPFHVTLMLMFIGVVFTHAYMGIQVVIDDYVPRDGHRLMLTVFNRFVMFFLSIVAIVSVLKLTIS